MQNKNLFSLNLICSCLLCLCTPCATAAQENYSNPFLEAGIPTVDRNWTGEDYVRFLDVISTGKIGLPRLSDKNGADILRRATSLKNLSFYKNKNTPVQFRLSDCGILVRSTSLIIGVYIKTSTDKNINLNPEMIDIFYFSLHAAASVLDLMDEMMPRIPKDSNYAARMEGVKITHGGITTMIVGAESMLRDKARLTLPERTKVLDAMATTFPRLKDAFTPGYRIELRKRLEEDRNLFLKAEDVQKIDKMIQILVG